MLEFELSDGHVRGFSPRVCPTDWAAETGLKVVEPPLVGRLTASWPALIPHFQGSPPFRLAPGGVLRGWRRRATGAFRLRNGTGGAAQPWASSLGGFLPRISDQGAQRVVPAGPGSPNGGAGSGGAGRFEGFLRGTPLTGGAGLGILTDAQLAAPREVVPTACRIVSDV